MAILNTSNTDTDGLVFAAYSDGTKFVDYVAVANLASTGVTFSTDSTRDVGVYAGAGSTDSGANSFGGVDLFCDSGRAFTVLVCCKQSATDSTGTILGRCSATPGNRTFQLLWSAGILTIYLRGTSTSIGNTGTLNDTNYHQHAISWDGSIARYAVDDGSAVTPTVGSAAIETENLLFGARTASSTAAFLTGKIQYVLIYDKVVAQAQRTRIWNDPLSLLTVSDVTAPTLSAPSVSSILSTSATGNVTTNEGNGTLYYRVSANSTESAATVKAGSSQAVSASGAQAVSLTGLTAATNYYCHFCHRDSGGNDSTVSSSAQFTTAAGAVKGATITLYNAATLQANLTSILALWWDATSPSGAPVYSTSSASTNSSGVLSLNINAVTTLSVGQSGFLLLYKLDGSDHKNSLVFAGRVAVTEI